MGNCAFDVGPYTDTLENVGNEGAAWAGMQVWGRGP